MRYKLLLIILSVIVLLISCSDTLESNNDEFTILKEIKMEGYNSWKMIRTLDSCIVIGGKKDNKPGIIKLDIYGNKIWESYSNMEITTYYMSNLEETPSGNFLMSGSMPYGAPYTAKYDKDGILLWEKTTVPYYLSLEYLKAVENSENETTIVTKAGVSKYDNNGNLIWGKFYSEDFCYSWNGVVFDVWDVYDCAITPDDQIIIIYKSGASDLVMMVVDSEGDILWGDFYYIDIESNAKLIVNDYYHYIIGSYKDVDMNKYLFSYKNYNYLDGSDPHSTSFEEIGNFSDYIASVKMSNTGTIMVTPTYEQFVLNFSDIKNFAWSYNVEGLDNSEHIYDSIEIDYNKYALIVYKDFAEGDSINYGTYLRFFQKN